MKIQQIMTADPIATGPETPLRDVAGILAEHRISGLPVIGERLEVLGVISEADIVVKEQGMASRRDGLLGRLRSVCDPVDRRLAARTAGEAMTSPPVTITADRHVSEAARLMTEKGVKRLPVVDGGGTLVGIVTRADLVRAFARPDEALEHDIRDVLARTLWIEDPGLHLGVDHGEVRLTGKVERRSDAELVPRFVARVPGVVAVDSTLRWAWDDVKAAKDGSTRADVPRW